MKLHMSRKRFLFIIACSLAAIACGVYFVKSMVGHSWDSWAWTISFGVIIACMIIAPIERELRERKKKS